MTKTQNTPEHDNSTLTTGSFFEITISPEAKPDLMLDALHAKMGHVYMGLSDVALVLIERKAWDDETRIEIDAIQAEVEALQRRIANLSKKYED